MKFDRFEYWMCRALDFCAGVGFTAACAALGLWISR